MFAWLHDCFMELDSETSHLVRATTKVTGFVGGSKMPLPISQVEAERMMQLSKGVKITVVSMEFTEGESVRVTEGPFANFQGTIEEVKSDKRSEERRVGKECRSR